MSIIMLFIPIEDVELKFLSAEDVSVHGIVVLKWIFESKLFERKEKHHLV